MSETTTHVPVMEVFASIQGEGAYVGEPQVFVRLRGCPLRCAYCSKRFAVKVCSRCKSVNYCDNKQICQGKHWQAVHKKQCPELQKKVKK